MKEQSQKSECTCKHLLYGDCQKDYQCNCPLHIHSQPSQKEEEKCKECEEDWYGYCYTCGRDMLDRPKPPEPEKENELLQGWEDQFFMGRHTIPAHKKSLRHDECGLSSKKTKIFIEKLLRSQAKKSFKEGAEMQKEVVICAAIVTEDGRTFRGHRHSDCFGAWQSAGYKPSANHVEGFITSKNRFVTRVEGRKLQDAAGIPSASRDGYAGNTLYSEDLY